MFGKLCNFKEQRGHCMVSYNDEEHRALSIWVSEQRNVCGKGIMDDTRKQRLDEIDYFMDSSEKGAA